MLITGNTVSPKSFISNSQRHIHTMMTRHSLPDVFLGKGVLKICSKFTGKHPCQSAISINLQSNVFFSLWVFFHVHSRFTGQQRKGEAIYLTPLYHFHPLHRHLDISGAITADSLPLHIASSRTRTGNLWFLSASR